MPSNDENVAVPSAATELDGSPSGDQDQVSGSFLAEFHAGRRELFEALYRAHFGAVDSAVSRLLGGVDRENVIHDVFVQLMTNADTRRRFQGGSIRAWLVTLAHNRAIDLIRRRERELPVGADPARFETSSATRDAELDAEAALVMEQFRTRVLPEKFQRVFQARFVHELDQPEAARLLGLSRTTLAYQEYRVRALLRRFVLGRH